MDRRPALALLLAAGASAVSLGPDGRYGFQLGADGKPVCGIGYAPYEARRGASDICTVYCVPEGLCEGELQTGKFPRLGITGQGHCRGYPNVAELGNVTKMAVNWMKALSGVCKGMKMLQFKNSERELCGTDAAAFSAVDADDGVCSQYCVPYGACEHRAKSGGLAYLGSVQRGNCLGRGFDQKADPGLIGQFQAQYLPQMQGDCQGIVVDHYRKPAQADGWGQPAQEEYGEAGPAALAARAPRKASAADADEDPPDGEGIYEAEAEAEAAGEPMDGPADGAVEEALDAAPDAAPAEDEAGDGEDADPAEPKKKSVPYHSTIASIGDEDEAVCREGTVAYQVWGPKRAYCTVFCVPKVQCELWMVTTGVGQKLGIMGFKGNCKKHGYTETGVFGARGNNITTYLETLGDPCQDVTYLEFTKPFEPVPAVVHAPPASTPIATPMAKVPPQQTGKIPMQQIGAAAGRRNPWAHAWPRPQAAPGIQARGASPAPGWQ